jgi:hypothetical protein
MDWKALAAKLTTLGLPILAQGLGTMVLGPIGGTMGETIGGVVAGMIANALGTEATPEAINTAIEQGNTTDVVTNLQAVQADVAAKWPALAQIAQAEEATAQTQIVQTTQAMKQDVVSATLLTNGSKWKTPIVVLNSLWRPLFAYELLLECVGFASIVFYALIRNDQFDIDSMIKLTVLILPYMAARFGLIGYHMNLRTKEIGAVTDAVSEPAPAVSLDDIKGLLSKAGVKIR